MSNPVLVVMSRGSEPQYPFEYQRFQGKTLTNHVRAAVPLAAVEQFRVKPESLLEPEAA